MEEKRLWNNSKGCGMTTSRTFLVSRLSWRRLILEVWWTNNLSKLERRRGSPECLLL
jgi:hypothetical protein